LTRIRPKPCPKCGSEEVVCLQRGDVFICECCNDIPEYCGYECKGAATEELAVELWDAIERGNNV
jgi:hypothetical protein